LDRDAAIGMSVKCFMIGGSHINSLSELVVVSGPYGLPPIRPALSFYSSSSAPVTVMCELQLYKRTGQPAIGRLA
jgi:hypothetical protein